MWNQKGATYIPGITRPQLGGLVPLCPPIPLCPKEPAPPIGGHEQSRAQSKRAGGLTRVFIGKRKQKGPETGTTVVGSRVSGQAGSLLEPSSHAPAPSGPMSSYGNIPEALCPHLPGQSEALLGLRVCRWELPGSCTQAPPCASFSPSSELRLTPQESSVGFGVRASMCAHKFKCTEQRGSLKIRQKGLAGCPRPSLSCTCLFHLLWGLSC